MSTENIFLMLPFPPSGSWLKPPCSKPRPHSDLWHSRVRLPFWQPCHRWTNLSWSDWIDLRSIMIYPQLSTPYLATSPQVQKLHFWLTISTGAFSFPTENTQKQKLRNKNRNTQKTCCNRTRSFGEVHLELKSYPVLDQQHPIFNCTQIYIIWSCLFTFSGAQCLHPGSGCLLRRPLDDNLCLLHIQVQTIFFFCTFVLM